MGRNLTAHAEPRRAITKVEKPIEDLNEKKFIGRV
jgi:hypothetical protein